MFFPFVVGYLCRRAIFNMCVPSETVAEYVVALNEIRNTNPSHYAMAEYAVTVPLRLC